MPNLTVDIFLHSLPWLYLAVISFVSFVVTCYDKIAAKKLPTHRIRERTLFLLAAFGGSIAMLITMYLIRHKTKHLSFMIGIPLIILAQTFLVVVIWYLL